MLKFGTVFTGDGTVKVKTSIYIFILFVVLIMTSGCEKKSEGPAGVDKLSVVATLFPPFDFARNVGGEKANVVLLLPPGVEPHGFEPRPVDMLKINSADIFIFTGKHMEPWVEKILKGIDRKDIVVVDASKGVALVGIKDGHEGGHKKEGGEHGKYDPHIWLDFSNAGKMVDAIVEGFAKIDPANKGFYTNNGEDLKAKLVELDNKYAKELNGCKHTTFIHGGHFAFNYLATRYNLSYCSAYQASPDSEPTPKQMIGLKKKMERSGIRYIYYEELITPRVANTIAKETGAGLLKLHGAHNVSKDEMGKGVTFLSLMEANLDSLKMGLECP